MSDGRDRLGAFVGMATFLGGVAILVLTFFLAYHLFQVPPERALDLQAGKPLDVNDAGRALLGLVYRIVMLLLMCVAGSMIASRGIKLYASGREPGLPVARERGGGEVSGPADRETAGKRD